MSTTRIASVGNGRSTRFSGSHRGASDRNHDELLAVASGALVETLADCRAAALPVFRVAATGECTVVDIAVSARDKLFVLTMSSDHRLSVLVFAISALAPLSWLQLLASPLCHPSAPFDVRAIDCAHTSDRFVTAGDCLSIWDLSLPNNAPIESSFIENASISLSWTISSPKTITTVKFSPNDEFIATCGDGDKFIKLWFQSQHSETRPIKSISISYDFIYLPHPSIVCNFEWRRTGSDRNDFNNKPPINALLTSTKDSIARIWCQKPLPTLLQDTSLNSPFTPHTLHTSPIEFEMRIALIPDIGDTTLHWIQPSAVSAAIQAATATTNSAANVSLNDPGDTHPASFYPRPTPKSTQKSATVVQEYPDMVFAVSKEGSVVVWGLQGLDAVGGGGGGGIETEGTLRRRRVVKAVVILKTAGGVIRLVDVESFSRGGRVDTFYEGSNPSDKMKQKGYALYFPPQISVVASSATGLVNIYRMNLDEFFGVRSWANPYLRVERSWCGHYSGAGQLVRHTSGSLIASISRRTVGVDVDEVLIYRMASTQIAARVNEGLDLVARAVFPKIPHSSRLVIEWFPNADIAIVCDGFQITLQTLSNATMTKITTLQDTANTAPITYLQIVHFPALDQDTKTVYLVVGISQADGCAYVWKVAFTEKGSIFQSNSLLNRTKLSINDAVASLITHIFPTNTLNHIFAPYATCGLHCFATVDASNTCTLWSVSGNESGVIERVGSFSLYYEDRADNSVGEIVCANADMFGRICFASKIQDSWEISVWDSGIADTGYRKTWSKEWTSEVIKLDVIVSSDGQTLLAVATMSGVDILCQDRLRAFDSPVEWIRVSEMVFPWEDTVHEISWLDNGSFAVALSTKLVVFSKWINPPPDAVAKTGSDVPQSLQTLVSRINGRLPDYHPNLLVHHLIWGKYAFIKFVFSVVHRFVVRMRNGGEGGVGEARGPRTMREIPSVLWKFFEGSDGAGSGNGGGMNYDDLFAEDGESRSTTEIGGFSQTQLDELKEMGDSLKIPHLSTYDQSRLIAMMSSFVQVEQEKRSIDENGSRFVFFARLLLSSQSVQAIAEDSILTSRDIAWAFYSDSQDFLVDFVNQSFKGRPLWKDVRSLGMGLWLRNTESLRRQIESIARNIYMAKEDKDPVDCSLFYICLKKKNVLLGLWKLAPSHPEQNSMLKFLANDFTEDRWQKAAVKNAFALLGKQRYEYAVAFFLLAERVKDAVNICLKHLKDLQLAIVICRLYEGDESPTLVETLQSTILPEAFKGGDRYLLSMAYTLLKDKEKALKVTMRPLKTLVDTAETSISNNAIIDPPLVVIHDHLQKSYKVMKFKDFETTSAKLQFEFMANSAIIYENMGCPGISLDMLMKAEELCAAAISESASPIAVESHTVGNSFVVGNKSNDMDWSQPITQPVSSVAGMDWGEPVSKQGKSETLDWSQPVSSSSAGMDWSQPVSSSGGFDWGEPVAQKPVDPMDEYEAFKSSIMPNEPDELELEIQGLERELHGGLKAETPVQFDVTIKPEIVLNNDQKRELEKTRANIVFQKWKMAVRMIYSLHKSMAVVSLNMDILSVDSMFKDYFNHIHNGLKRLAEYVDMPFNVMDSVVAKRYREMDAFVAYSQLPAISASTERNSLGFSALLVEGSNHLSALVFDGSHSVDSESIDPVVDFAKRLLWSIICWYEKEDSGQSSSISLSVMSQTAATAFLALAICYIKAKDYKSLWWIVGLSDRFFEVLVAGAKKKSLKPMILDLLIQREPIIQPDSESDNDSDEDFMEDIPAEKSLLAENLLSSVALQHIGLDFHVFVRHLKDGSDVDEAYGFLSEVVLTKLSGLLFDLHARVRSNWSGAMKFSISKLPTYLLNNYAKGVWALIKRTSNVKKLSALIISGDTVKTDKPIEIMSPISNHTAAAHDDTKEDSAKVAPPKREVHQYDDKLYEVVFRTKDIIGTFAINPLDPNCFAVATHETIVEFDLETSLRFHTREEVLAKRRESVDDLAIKSSKKFIQQKTLAMQRLPDSEAIKRNLSYDSLQKAVKDSMMDLRRRDSEIDSGRRIHRDVVSVSSLQAHPTLNYYLAGVGDGNSESVIKLYQFGQKGDLVSYMSGSNARVTKCRFDPFGGRFGACDAKGELRLWKFDATEQSLHPTQIIPCNSAVTNDFSFVNSSTLIATAGVSSNGSNICLWDTLLPSHKMRVKNFHVTEGGAYSITHTNRYQSIICGGKKGDIFIFDIRQMRHRKTFHAHDSTVKSLFVDESNGLLISGSSGGDIKVWDLSMFNSNENWLSDDAALFRQGKFPGHSEKVSNMSSYGIMQISVHENRIYCCGADGSLSRCRV